MKLLIISDIHLSHKFKENLYKKLATEISAADQVIINGDLWEHYLTNFDKFVNSEWQKLFPLLKSKKTVYIFGNHDPQDECDERVNLFSDIQTLRYKMEINGRKIHFEHGHLCSENNLNVWPFATALGYYLQGFIRKTGILFNQMNKTARRWNEQMKQWGKSNLDPDEIMICGHSHLQENSLSQNYINSGLNCYGHFEILTIDESGFHLTKDRY